MKDNKLIAEFMGFQQTNLGWYDNLETIKFNSDGNTFDELKYHSSWDWLMAVVEKCFDRLMEDDNWDDLSFCLNDALLTTNIDEVYKAVINIIKQIK